MEGGGFPNGDDSWMLEPCISLEPRLCSSVQYLKLVLPFFIQIKPLQCYSVTCTFKYYINYSFYDNLYCSVLYCELGFPLGKT